MGKDPPEERAGSRLQGLPFWGAPQRDPQGPLGEDLLSPAKPSLNPVTPHPSPCVIYLSVHFSL